MSSTDETLEKYFNEHMNGRHDGTKNKPVTVEDLIDWFKEIQVFDTLNILYSDVEESFKKVCEKYRTPFSKTKSNITFKDFVKILDELAEKIKLNADELKIILLDLIESREKYEKVLMETLKKAQESFSSFTDWLWSTKVFEKFEVAKSEVMESFKNSQKNPGKFTYEDLVIGVKQIAAKHNIDAEELLSSIVKSQTDPGLLPLPEDKEGNK